MSTTPLNADTATREQMLEHALLEAIEFAENVPSPLTRELVQSWREALDHGNGIQHSDVSDVLMNDSSHSDG